LVSKIRFYFNSDYTRLSIVPICLYNIDYESIGSIENKMHHIPKSIKKIFKTHKDTSSFTYSSLSAICNYFNSLQFFLSNHDLLNKYLDIRQVYFLKYDLQ